MPYEKLAVRFDVPVEIELVCPCVHQQSAGKRCFAYLTRAGDKGHLGFIANRPA
jgi:hypothetical protein